MVYIIVKYVVYYYMMERTIFFELNDPDIQNRI